MSYMDCMHTSPTGHTAHDGVDKVESIAHDGVDEIRTLRTTALTRQKYTAHNGVDEVRKTLRAAALMRKNTHTAHNGVDEVKKSDCAQRR